jgi:hypothetical protein
VYEALYAHLSAGTNVSKTNVASTSFSKTRYPEDEEEGEEEEEEVEGGEGGLYNKTIHNRPIQQNHAQ